MTSVPLAAPQWRQMIERSLKKNRSLAYSRYVQLATVRPDGRPAVRTVVYRCALLLRRSRCCFSGPRSTARRPLWLLKCFLIFAPGTPAYATRHRRRAASAAQQRTPPPLLVAQTLQVLPPLAVAFVSPRGFLDGCDSLTFVTDRRSSKVAEVAANPAAEVAWYLPITREQVRCGA